MTEPIGISHYGICVRDLDRSLAFYRDILGMQCGPIREQNMAEHFGDRQAQVYQKPRKSRRAARLTWGDEGSAPGWCSAATMTPPLREKPPSWTRWAFITSAFR